MVVIAMALATALLATVLAPYDPYQIDIANRLQGPSSSHWMGTDVLGRDTLSRIVYGARTTFQVAVGALLIGSLIGVPVGRAARYFGLVVDSLVMRLMVAIMAFPGLLLAIALAASLGGGLVSIYAAIVVSGIPHYARLARGITLGQKERDYTAAARLAGERDWSIVLREILPNCTAPLMVAMTLDFAHAVLIEPSLSFLGLGFSPPTASWGLMLKEVSPFLELQPWGAFFPGLAIFLTIFGFNLLGDGLRDIFDPRHYEV